MKGILTIIVIAIIGITVCGLCRHYEEHRKFDEFFEDMREFMSGREMELDGNIEPIVIKEKTSWEEYLEKLKKSVDENIERQDRNFCEQEVILGG